MINKIIPRFMNKSIDSRLRKPTEFKDALNISVVDEHTAGPNVDNNGSSLVIKPKKGNELIQGQSLLDEQTLSENTITKCIGAAPDNNLDVIYYAVWANTADDMGVYAYDPFGNLPGSTGEVMRKVFTHPLFNFPQDGFSKMDVVYVGKPVTIDGKRYDRRPYLYFTDNTNEPRKLDVFRAMTEDFADVDDPTITDFITACPKTPVFAPTFEFNNDPNRSRSHFENVNGVQFAYQLLYKENVESAISTYSDLAVPPAYLNQGALTTPPLLSGNRCVVTIPSTYITDEVESVRLVAREGNTNTFFEVEEVPFTGEDIVVDYYHDRIIKAVPIEEQDKLYTDLPQKAEAQSITDNRLLYGNYTRGRNNPTPDVVMTPEYSPRDEDFSEFTLQVTPHMFYLDKDREIDGLLGNIPNGVPNRIPGFHIDTFQLPFSLEADVILNLEFTVSPDKNWHLFSGAGQSFHSSRYVFPTTGEFAVDQNDGTLANDLDTKSPVFFTDTDGVAQTDGAPMFGANNGVASTPVNQVFPTWDTVNGSNAGQQTEVVFGTSAANPLILKGGSATFGFSVCLTEPMTVPDLVPKLKAVLLGATDIEGLDILSQDISPSYVFDLGLRNQDPTTLTISQQTSPIANLITAVGTREQVAGGDQFDNINSSNDGQFDINVSPCGYFIVDTARVNLRLRDLPYANDISDAYTNDIFVGIDVASIEDIDTVTAIPQNDNSNSLLNESWRIISKDDLLGNANEGVYMDGDGSNLNIITQPNDGGLEDIQIPSLENLVAVMADTRSLIPGYLNLNSARLYAGTDDWLIDFLSAGIVITEDLPFLFGHSLQDGENGPIARYQAGGSFIQEGSVSSPMVQQGSFSNRFIGGVGPQYLHIEQICSSLNQYNPFQLTTPFHYTLSNVDDRSEFEVLAFDSFGFRKGGIATSFKTKASHAIGMVYFDERGRPGDVMGLGEVYVTGYSVVERGGELFGSVSIRVDINHEPPEWAFSYKFVYAGNSSLNDFVQYNAGGAFVPTEENVEENAIYVSLNYLQENSNVSYSKAFGAVNENGDKDLYTFSAGDRVRIISYQTDDNVRIYPYNYELEVIGTATLSEDPEENPLVDPSEEATVPEYKKGQFIILKNNPDLQGFTYSNVKEGNLQAETASHLWNNRTLFEVYKPSRIRDAEERIYRDVSETYRVIRQFDEEGNVVLTHEENPVTLTKGDVWWRRIAMNTPTFEDGLFKNIIQDEDSNPKFRPFFVESNTFSDFFPGNKVDNFGKPRVIENNGEIINRSSLVIGDENNYAQRINRFTSFNPSKIIFKDLPNQYGAINFIIDRNDHVIVLQEGKVSAIPVKRNIFTDASGVDEVVISSDVLGIPRFFAHNYGSDNSPESVVSVGLSVYFCDKTTGEVYKYNPDNGLNVISQAGMNRYIKDLFERVQAQVDGSEEPRFMRAPMGYDPLNDEVVLTVHSEQLLPYIENNIPRVPLQDFPNAGAEDEQEGGV